MLLLSTDPLVHDVSGDNDQVATRNFSSQHTACAVGSKISTKTKLNIKYLMLSVTCILARFDALHCILISNPFSLLRSGQRTAVKISIQKSNEKNHEARGIHDNQAQPHHHSTKLLQSIDKRWRHFTSHWSSPVIPKTNVNGIKKIA